MDVRFVVSVVSNTNFVPPLCVEVQPVFIFGFECPVNERGAQRVLCAVVGICRKNAKPINSSPQLDFNMRSRTYPAVITPKAFHQRLLQSSDLSNPKL
jgi:hypothetical protein